MTISIEHMRLYLPVEFKDDAGTIARFLAEELGHFRFTESRTLDVLEVPPVRVRADAGSREVARAIAQSVATEIGGRS